MPTNGRVTQTRVAFGQIWALDRYAWVYADLTHDLRPEDRMRGLYTLCDRADKFRRV